MPNPQGYLRLPTVVDSLALLSLSGSLSLGAIVHHSRAGQMGVMPLAKFPNRANVDFDSLLFHM
jgi:hypothetical protein